MSDFAENLRNAMFFKRLKAIDVANGTKIPPPTISRYLSGTHQPTTDNLITISKYLGISPEALLSSSDAPESIQKSRAGSSSVTEPLFKTIEVQDKLIRNLEKQIKNLEEAKTDEVRNLKAQVDMLRVQNDQWKAGSQGRLARREGGEPHAKGREKTKNPTKPNKQKVGFLKKHKKPKK